MKRITLLLFICCVLFNTSQAETRKRVYLLASYEEQHICGGPQEQGIIKGLNKEGWFEGINLDIEFYYMDTKNVHNTPEAIAIQATLAEEKIDIFKPDVLITIDDNAFTRVGINYAMDSNVSVVFSGVNAQPETLNQKIRFMDNRHRPGYNITGVYEKLYVLRSIEVMMRSVPSIGKNKFVGITDFTPTGQAITKQLQIEMASRSADIDWELKQVKDWESYQNLILSLNEDSDVKALYAAALLLKSADGTVFSAADIFKWTIENSRKPEMAINYFFSKLGLFGGAAVDFNAMGVLVGKMAGQILNGKKAGDISIADAPDYAIVFNRRRAKQLAVQIPFPLLTAADFVYE